MVAKKFDKDKCFILASSVVYATLISSVPFLAFIIALLTAFGAFDIAREALLELVAQQFGATAGGQLLNVVEGFTRNASSLGVVGLVSFLITSIILINRVWVTINQIYHTSTNRNQVTRFIQFITFLVVGTLLISAYFSVNTLMSDFLSQYYALTAFKSFIGKVGPFLILYLIFFLLITVIPNTKVRIRSALLGAFVGTLVFQTVNWVFNRIIMGLLNYSIIYGSLGSVLMVLFWIYLWWVIIFWAIEVAYVHQYRPEEVTRRGLPNPPAEQIACGFDILNMLATNFKQGRGAMNTRDLGLKLKIPDRTLFTYLDLLEQCGYVIKMDRTGRHYIPARPLDDISTEEIAAVIYGCRADTENMSEGELLARQLYESGVGSLSKKTLQELEPDD